MKHFKDLYSQKAGELQVEKLKEIETLEDTQTRLFLGEMTIGTKNTIALAHALRSDVQFTEIDLSESYMGDEGCIVLCEALKKNRTLESLNLSGGNIHSKGAVAIGEMLRENRSMRQLFMEWNSAGVLEIGIGNIADALKKNEVLESIDLRNNRITSEGALKLANSLKSNSTLRKLDLRWNSLGTNGGEYLREVLETTNMTVTEILLSGNEVDYEVLDGIQKLLVRNRGILDKQNNELELENMMVDRMTDLQKHQQKHIRKLESTLVNERSDFDVQMKETGSNIRKLKDTLNFDEKKMISLVDQIKHNELNLSKIESEKNYLAERIITNDKIHNDVLEKYREENRQLKQLKNETSKMLETKSRNLAAATLRNEQIKTQNIGLIEIEKTLKMQLDMKDQTIKSLNDKIKQKVNENTECNNKILDCHQKIKDLETKVEELTIFQRKYNDMVLEMKTLRINHENEVTQITQRHRAEMMDKERGFEEQVLNEQSQKMKYKNNYEEKNNEYMNLSKRMDIKVNDMQQTNRDLKQRNENMDMEKQSVENECNSLKVELKQTQYQLENQKEKQRQMQRKNDNEIKYLNEKLERIITDHDKEKEKIKMEVKKKERELDQSINHNKKLALENSTLREEHTQALIDIETKVFTFLKKTISSHRK